MSIGVYEREMKYRFTCKGCKQSGLGYHPLRQFCTRACKRRWKYRYNDRYRENCLAVKNAWRKKSVGISSNRQEARLSSEERRFDPAYPYQLRCT